ncbi:MAG: hypothetical protein KDE19_14330, partial [Caldilineaceae bacterium]|nr:hypothetical protein [Caldilineaceae bacterium]
VLLRLDAPTYETLIGVGAHVAQLKKQLVASDPPWVVAIEGMGGLGKTALADDVMRHLIAEYSFADFAWVTMRQQHLGLDGTIFARAQPLQTVQAMVDALAAQLSEHDPLVTTLTYEKKLAFLEGRFHQHPHLVVIDNLETFKDLQEWLPLLRRWVNPTKFLLTSREHVARDGSVFPFVLPELHQADALALIRQESTLRNLSHLATIADAQLLPIYEVVGGNPLAIRLVVGQLYAHDFDLVLGDLIHARGAKAEALYSYIYQQAWSRLDDLARQVWLTMPLLIGDYATVDNLGEVSGLAEMDVRNALEILATQNLINCHGTYNAHYYTLHSLTQTFLQEQVAKWD